MLYYLDMAAWAQLRARIKEGRIEQKNLCNYYAPNLSKVIWVWRNTEGKNFYYIIL